MLARGVGCRWSAAVRGAERPRRESAARLAARTEAARIARGDLLYVLFQSDSGWHADGWRVDYVLRSNRQGDKRATVAHADCHAAARQSACAGGSSAVGRRGSAQGANVAGQAGTAGR